MLCCVELVKRENIQIFVIFRDKMQERNAKEHKDRFQVYPCIALHCDESQSEGDAMQCNPLRHILNWALVLTMNSYVG